MTILEYYALFALATGIMSTMDLYWPVVSKAKIEGIKNELTENRLLGALVFCFFNIVLAPFIFPVILFPTLSEKAAKGLDTSIREPKINT